MSTPKSKIPMKSKEVMLLVNLVEGCPAVRCRETNAMTNKLKEQAWLKLTDNYNASNGSTYRNANQLKIKWDNLKKTARKRAAMIRMNNQAGGRKINFIPRDAALDKVVSILESPYSGPMVPHHTTPRPSLQSGVVPHHTTPRSSLQSDVVPHHTTPHPSPRSEGASKDSEGTIVTEEVELVETVEVEKDADLELSEDVNNTVVNQAQEGNTSNTISAALIPTEKHSCRKPKAVTSLKTEGKKKKGNARTQIYGREVRGSYLSQYYKDKSLRTKLENEKLQIEIEKLKLEVRLLELEVAFKENNLD